MRRIVNFRNFLIAVAICLTASAGMVLAPFAAPRIPLFSFITANWVLWIVVAGVFRRSKANWVTHSESVWWDRLTSLALVCFTIAGLFAFYHTESMFPDGDVTELRGSEAN